MELRIIKSKNIPQFTTIDSMVLRDPNLSLKAKGLYCYIMSLPPDWVVYKKELLKHFTDGKDSLNSAFDELETHGFVVGADQIKNEDGKFTGRDYVFYTYPFNNENHYTDAENPPRNRCGKSAFTDAENPQLLNKQFTNNIYTTSPKEKKQPALSISGAPLRDERESKNPFYDLRKTIPPTRQMMNEYTEWYLSENKNKSFDGVDKFLDFYNSKGWKVGSQKMQDWQAAVRNWMKEKEKVEEKKFWY